MWYRILQIFRVLFYIVSVLFAYNASSQASTFIYGVITFAIVVVIASLIIEVIESSVVYLFTGKNVLVSLVDKYKKLNDA